MTHNDIQDNLEAFADHQLSADDQASVQLHLTHCAACDGTVRRLRWMSQTFFQPAKPPTPTEFFVSRVMGSIRAGAPVVAPGFLSGVWRWPALALSLLALILIATAENQTASDSGNPSTRTVLLAAGGATFASQSSSTEPMDSLLDYSVEDI